MGGNQNSAEQTKLFSPVLLKSDMLSPSYMSPTPCPLNQTSARTRLTLLNCCWSAAGGAVDVVARVLWPECCGPGESRAPPCHEGPHPLAQCPSLRLHQVSEVIESLNTSGAWSHGQQGSPPRSPWQSRHMRHDTCSGKKLIIKGSKCCGCN